MDKIILNGMEFYGFHGLYPEEKSKGQKFQVDLTLEISLSEAAFKDSIDSTVDYAKVFYFVQEIVEGPSSNLLEYVAEQIASTVLYNFDVQRVTVSIRKPDVKIEGGNLEYAGVTIKRDRDEGAVRPKTDQ